MEQELFILLILLFLNTFLQARRHVSDAVLQEIRTLNYLDVDLFKYAQEIFAMRHVQLMGNLDMKVSLFSSFLDLCKFFLISV